MTESQLEKYLRNQVNKLDGLSRKFTSPSQRGVPDRIVFWGGGVIHFVELKTETGRLTKLQENEHVRLQLKGCTVYTLHGKDEVNEYLENQKTILKL